MTEQPQPEQAIQAGAPTPAVPPPESVPPNPDVIPLPPLPPAPTLATIDQRWSVFEVAMLLLVATLCFFLGSFAVTTSDFWLRLATGRAIANGEPLGVDPFSFASVQNGAPVPWVNHSWLFDLAVYHLYTAFGGASVVIAQAVLMVALLLILVNLRPEGSSRLAALLLAGLTVLVVSQRPLPSPMVVSYVLFGLMFLLLCRGGVLGSFADDETPAPRALWGLPLLFAVWVNFDAWFFLGLVTLALIVLGNMLAIPLGWNGRSRPATQLAVLVASGAACLLNPYGAQVFTFPAEAAYALGAWLPRAFDGGAETLRGFAQVDAEALIAANYVGPFHQNYRPLLPQTFVLVSVAFFLLLLLSVLSFVLTSVRGLATGSGIPLGRLLAWGLVAFLAMKQILLIPLFAVVAGPIAMLNFADFGRWSRSREGVPREPAFHPGLARLVTAMLVLIALGLAWPGWLHVRIGSTSSPRRVAWHVIEDPSLRAAAEALKRAQAKHVFNYSFDIANYCAWFAPGVRCYVDQRLALFRHEGNRYAKAKKALVNTAADIITDAPSSSARRDWLETFQDHAIDHLAMRRSIDPPELFITHMCWLDPKHWIHEYVDGRGGVFGWSPEGKGNPLAFHETLLREAFGPVPEERRVPRTMATMPETSALSLYLKGQPPVLSSNVTKPFVYRSYFTLIQQSWPRAYIPAQLVGVWMAPAGLCAAAPGSALLAYTARTMPFYLDPRPRARDPGPVAAPLLAVRQARRVVLEHPAEPRGYKALHLAYIAQAFDVEEYWAGGGKTERLELRRVQIATAFRTYLDLQPDDWNARREFAEFLQRDYLLDAALEQMTQALQSLEKQRLQARDKRIVDKLKSEEKEMAAFIKKKIEPEVKRRRTDFDIKAGRKKPLEKFDLAFLAAYRTVDERNQEFLDRRGMGLALEGLKQLENINPSELKAEEKTRVRFWRFRLLMQLGRLGEAGEELDFIEHPQLADDCRLWYVAALGKYELMDQTIIGIEEMQEKSAPLAAQRAKLRIAVVGLMSLSGTGELPVIARAHYLNWSGRPMAINSETVQQLTGAHANSRTLRGLFALEAGDTAKAAELFAEALRIAGPDGRFTDRVIAERYLELLRAQMR